MVDVRKVYLTKEVSILLGYDTAYLIRLSKGMLEAGVISECDFRPSGRRNYLFNQKAVDALKVKLGVE